MHGSPGKPGSTNRGLMWNWTTLILTVHAVIFLTLVGLAVGFPGASEWISAAVQADFLKTAAPPPASMQVAHPLGQTDSIRSN